MMSHTLKPDDALRPGEVARLMGVHHRTVIRWADTGKIPHFRTTGGHRRFRRQHVDSLIAERLNPGNPKPSSVRGLS
ncbi:helix-turn-helix domain-containing protein [Nocardiopsis exhalans]